MTKGDAGEQQRQIQVLKLRVERMVEEKLAESKSGTALHALYGKRAHLTIVIAHAMCHMQAIAKHNETFMFAV